MQAYGEVLYVPRRHYLTSDRFPGSWCCVRSWNDPSNSSHKRASERAVGLLQAFNGPRLARRAVCQRRLRMWLAICRRASAILRKVTISFVGVSMSVWLAVCLSVRVNAWKNSPSTGWFSMEVDI